MTFPLGMKGKPVTGPGVIVQAGTKITRAPLAKPGG